MSRHLGTRFIPTHGFMQKFCCGVCLSPVVTAPDQDFYLHHHGIFNYGLHWFCFNCSHWSAYIISAKYIDNLLDNNPNWKQ